MKKPEPPAGYRMLIEGQDFTDTKDLIWITEERGSRWAMSITQTDVGIAIAAITGLVVAGVAIYKNWDEIKAKAIEIWGAITEWFSVTLESINNLS